MQLVVSAVVITADGRFLDRQVHPLDLSIGQRVVRLGEPMFDPISGTDAIEEMPHVSQGRPAPITRRMTELDAIICQNGMDLVGYGFDEVA